MARLEAIIDSSLIVDGTTGNGTCMSYEGGYMPVI
jgi:hypothetical protein